MLRRFANLRNRVVRPQNYYLAFYQNKLHNTVTNAELNRVVANASRKLTPNSMRNFAKYATALRNMRRRKAAARRTNPNAALQRQLNALRASGRTGASPAITGLLRRSPTITRR